jgi:hypothetical protein
VPKGILVLTSKACAATLLHGGFDISGEEVRKSFFEDVIDRLGTIRAKHIGLRVGEDRLLDNCDVMKSYGCVERAFNCRE